MGRVKWGDEGYAREELVAELGSAFLCADLEITPEVRPDHAAYIGHWLKALQDDKRLIFSAAAHAQRAADYLHSLQSAQEPEPPEAVLRAMEDSDDPLPDAVAAAWAS
jgi:antirestriction protein ArdC